LGTAALGIAAELERLKSVAGKGYGINCERNWKKQINKIFNP